MSIFSPSSLVIFTFAHFFLHCSRRQDTKARQRDNVHSLTTKIVTPVQINVQFYYKRFKPLNMQISQEIKTFGEVKLFHAVRS